MSGAGYCLHSVTISASPFPGNVSTACCSYKFPNSLQSKKKKMNLLYHFWILTFVLWGSETSLWTNLRHFCGKPHFLVVSGTRTFSYTAQMWLWLLRSTYHPWPLFTRLFLFAMPVGPQSGLLLSTPTLSLILHSHIPKVLPDRCSGLWGYFWPQGASSWVFLACFLRAPVCICLLCCPLLSLLHGVFQTLWIQILYCTILR